jgi:hypothetical protein
MYFSVLLEQKLDFIRCNEVKLSVLENKVELVLNRRYMTI